jgi:hypothetical protein
MEDQKPRPQLQGAEFPSWELTLESEDPLVVYSDGVVDCRHPEQKTKLVPSAISKGETDGCPRSRV